MSNPAARGQAVISQYNSDASTNLCRARVMYDTGYIHTSGPRSLVQKVNHEVVGGPTTTIATGCGAGGTNDFPEPLTFGEGITATLSGADPKASTAWFVMGVPGARTQFPCASCNALLGPFVFGAAVTAGGAEWSACADAKPMPVTRSRSPSPSTSPRARDALRSGMAGIRCAVSSRK